MFSLLSYVLLIGKVMGAERSIPDFAIYVFTGLTAWQLFSDIISASTGSIVGNSGIIKKIHLPREIFPLASTGASLFNFAMQFLILVLATFIITPPLVGFNLLYLPLGLILLVVWATAFGLILAAANVYFRDIQYLVEVVLLVGMWASPIVYSWSMVTSITGGGVAIEDAYLTNPVTLYIMCFQRATEAAGANVPTAPHLGIRMILALAIGIVVLVIAPPLLSVLQRKFAQAF